MVLEVFKILYLLNQSVLNHHIDPAPDAFVQFFTFALQSNLYYPERTFFLLLLAETAVLLARHVTYLKGMHHTFGVLDVGLAVVFGVQYTQLVGKFVKSLAFILLKYHGTGLVINCGYVINAIAHSVDIHH